MTPGVHHAIKMALEAQLLGLARDGIMPSVSVHSVVEEGDTVFAYFSLEGRDEMLSLEFARPALCGPDEIDEFCRWLIEPSEGSIH